MGYIAWAMVAMVGYGAFAIFLKLSFRTIPAEVALVVTNACLTAVAFSLVLIKGYSFEVIGLNKQTAFIGLACLMLCVSCVAYYIALSRGPVSVVAPIFALNFAIAGILRILFLGESVTVTRCLGLILAVGAIVLLAR